MFQLKSVINELDEVVIADRRKKKFNVGEYNKSLQSQIQEDIINNPGLYGGAASKYGLDFVALFGLVKSLFRKKGAREPEIIYMTSYDLKQLFDSSNFFSKTILNSSLGIDTEHSFLFYEYCTARGLNKTLLLKERELELLDSLVIRSTEFKDFLKEAKKNE